VKSLCLLPLIVLGFAVSSPAIAGETENAACKKYVQSFYDWYVSKNQGNPNDDTIIAVFKNKKFAFSKELESKLKEDHDVAGLFPGEIVGLDYDPFLNAQDVATKYTVGQINSAATKYRADVFSVFDGKKSSKPVVVPELILQNGKWVFVNFIYPDASRKENQDLITTLNQLKKDRPPLPKVKSQTKK
jgi:hypothetical protein